MYRVPQALLKRFAASVTGFARRYRTDPYLRTEANVIALQVLFSLLLVSFMAVTLTTLYQSSLSIIVADMQEQIFVRAPNPTADVVIAKDFNEVQIKDFVVVTIVGLLFMLILGYLTVRIAMQPVKDTLKAQKQFIGNIAHELRTPLSIIKTNTELRLLDSDVPKNAIALHRSNLEELDHLSEIINNLLTLNTLVLPGLLELGNVSIGDVVDRVMDKLYALARKKEIVITIRKSDGTAVWGNTSAIEQIATNIIKNAIAYTPKGGTIQITVRPGEESTIMLAVRDSGVGIAEKDLFRVFDPFYRADASRARRGGGSGLGLAIVSELVRLHHGRITLQSTPNHGTTVTVFFPIGKRAEKAENNKTPGEVSINFLKRRG